MKRWAKFLKIHRRTKRYTKPSNWSSKQSLYWLVIELLTHPEKKWQKLFYLLIFQFSYSIRHRIT